MRTPSQVLNINHKYFDFFSGNTNMCAISEYSSIDCVVLSDCFCLFAYLTTLLRAVSVVLSVCVYVLVIQSCPTPCYPMDCGPPGSSVHGILQARRLQWVASLYSSGSSRLRNRIPVSSISGRCFHHLSHQGSPVFLLVVCIISLFSVLQDHPEYSMPWC